MCNQVTHQDHITVKVFRELLPVFADSTKYPRASIERWIEMAKCAFNPCVWGCNLVWAEANWIAHQLTFTGMGAGMIYASSKHVGDTSVSYSDVMLQKMMGNPYYATPYGQQYLALLGTLTQGVGIMIV